MSATTITESAPSSIDSGRIARRVIGALLASVAIVSLALALPGLGGVASQISHLQPGWLIAAVALEVGSCVGFVVIFRRFFDRLPAAPARELALVEQGAGALLPGGGVGALAVGGWFMRRQGMSTQHIVERSSGLFFLTSAVNVAALVAAAALLLTGLMAGPRDLELTGLPLLGGLAVSAAVFAAPRLLGRSRRQGWPADLATGLGSAVQSLRRPSWRLTGAVAYLGLDIAALAATFAATGHPVPVAPLVLAYLLGYLANLIPVPGGFGVLEGGLAGALIAYGAPGTQAAAAVIVYHAIAFWVPSLGGLFGYARLRGRQSHRTVPAANRAIPTPPLSLDPRPVCV